MGMNATYIEFDGVSSKDLGIVVEGYPGRVIQERDTEFFDVPGRNGSLLIDHKRFKNYTQEYIIHWFGQDANIRTVSDWLNKPGYKKFIDNSDPEHYRMASFIGPVDVENRMNQMGRCKISFNFKPQFFREGVEDILLLEGYGTVENTGQPSHPLLYIGYSGLGGSLNIGGRTLYIMDEMPQEPFYFDCETHNAYSVDGVTNLNKFIRVSGNGLITLENGETEFSAGIGGIVSVIVSPRWWDLQ